MVNWLQGLIFTYVVIVLLAGEPEPGATQPTNWAIAETAGVLPLSSLEPWLHGANNADGEGKRDETRSKPTQRVHQLDARRLAYLGVDFQPPIDAAPPGGGGAALYAGANYTAFILRTDQAVKPDSKVRLVVGTMHPSSPPSGHCNDPIFMLRDTSTPLDGLSSLTASGNNALWTDGMVVAQGGLYKLCYSPLGTFGIADGALIPDGITQYRVYGAKDSCHHGPGCLANRRFFCHAPYPLYVDYLPQGTMCYMFIQNVMYSPLLYSRLTWTSADKCGGQVGQGLQQWNNVWAREVQDLTHISLGATRWDLTTGFHYRLCFCPSYDSAADGVCGETPDFVQQVGILDGLIASFLDVSQIAVTQILPLSRFTIRVDCGGGPWCESTGRARIKAIPKAWNPQDSNTDLPHWDSLNACPQGQEVAAWYSPPNCINTTSGKHLSSHCQMSGGTDPSNKFFGINEIRIKPLYESDVLMAQMFDLCFVHDPAEADGINHTQYNPASDDAMQNSTRVFFKVGQLVVEPLIVLNPKELVMLRPVTLRVGPPNSNWTNNLRSEPTMGPILKLVEEADNSFVDATACGNLRTREYNVEGLVCPNASSCFPRATKVKNELTLSIRVRNSGVFAVCYCEKWVTEVGACENVEHWVLASKVLVAGPRGNQDWVLDTNMIQSFELNGYGFTSENAVRILQPGEFCTSLSYERTDPSVRVCAPDNMMDPACPAVLCRSHGPVSNCSSISDVTGSVWRYNSTEPKAYVESVVPSTVGSLLNFAQVPLIQPNDRIHLEPNIDPQALHWVRKRDYERVIKGEDIGHKVLELRNSGRSARIPLSLNPFPPLVIIPEHKGRWWRSNKFRVPYIRGSKQKENMPVCWGPKAGEYYAFAGFLSIEDPQPFERVVMDLTTTASGATAPVIIRFTTGSTAKYLAPRNAVQLRVTFMNTSALAPALAAAEGGDLPDMVHADQLHEASQVVCGQLFMELYSPHPYGFPVPRGCYFQRNMYGSQGLMQAIYILFEPLNGLAANTEYILVMKARLGPPISDYVAQQEMKLIEVTALDDIVLNPEGVIEVGFVNPYKPIVEAAGLRDFRWFNGGDGGISIIDSAFERLALALSGPGPQGSALHFDGDTFGLSLLMRGDEVGRINASAVIRLYLRPITAWHLPIADQCLAECVAQPGHVCGPNMLCRYESSFDICEDFVPPGQERFLDTRGKECDWYAAVDTRCEYDGTSYTPWHGYSALFSCCTCNGGVRYPSNVIKLQMPSRMDTMFGNQVMHTVRFWNVAPMPQRGFFPLRFGAQVSRQVGINDNFRPDYTTTTGLHIARTPRNASLSTVGTLVAVDGWGNSRPFKRDEGLNDFYLRLQFPSTIRSSAGARTASMVIQLPPGYKCRYVLPANPRGFGDDQVPLPVLPIDPPTGNGALPPSTANATGIGTLSGDWEFIENRCIFRFSPNLTLFDRQRVFLYIFAKNPDHPLPSNDPSNLWFVNFTSSGDVGFPAGHGRPVCWPYAYPVCNETGVDYYVNPVGYPTQVRNFDLLFPPTSALETTQGPYQVSIPANESHQYTQAFGVLGMLTHIVVQPSALHFGARSILRIWFVPDLGSERDGLLDIECPIGFVFDNPCLAKNLGISYYARYAPPSGSGDPRVWPVWPLYGKGSCVPRTPNTARMQVATSLLSGRRFGFEVEVTNPNEYSVAAHDGIAWAFKLVISDGEGYARDGTYTTGVFQPQLSDPWDVYTHNVLFPIAIQVNELRPYVWTNLQAIVLVGPIVFNRTIIGQMRVMAPDGYEWAWDTYNVRLTFVTSGLPDMSPLPGGAPPLPEAGRLNVITWPSNETFQAGLRYGFRTTIHVPSMPPRSSSNSWFFEWGFNNTGAKRVAATATLGHAVRSLRNAMVEFSSTLAGERATVWFWIETITNITAAGSLEVKLPFEEFYFRNFTDFDGRYCTVATVEAYGSRTLGRDLRCRRVTFPNSLTTSLSRATEVRLEFSANITGMPAGKYVFEVNVTNPITPIVITPESQNPCNRSACFSFYSMEDRYPSSADNSDGQWVSQEVPYAGQWAVQNDYWTSIPALRITTPLMLAEIMDLDLVKRLACQRNDRPGQRSALVFAFALNLYSPQDGDFIKIRAPVGWLFDPVCDFFSGPDDVFPSLGHPTEYVTAKNVTYPVQAWPQSAAVRSCRGDGHIAKVELDPGLQPKQVYIFRISLMMTPTSTPRRNAWQLTYGAESSGEIPGFQVWTFPRATMDPVSLRWTEKANTLATPLAIEFEVENSLRVTDVAGISYKPMLRLIMPSLFEVVVEGPNQDINGGRCYVVLLRTGKCRACQTPYSTDEVTCTREYNRKNVAMVVLSGNASVVKGLHYRMSVLIYNPHIEDTLDTRSRHFNFESFLGSPVPPATAPAGYALDAAEVTGFKISAKAKLTFEPPPVRLRNGSTFVNESVPFTMRFPDILEPGDTLEMRTPPGFMTSRLIRGLYNRVVCLNFTWAPVSWPENWTNQTQGPEPPPPFRPPPPPRLPPWARGARIAQLPVNTTNASANFSDVNATNLTIPVPMVFQNLGFTAWSIPLAMLENSDVLHNLSGNTSAFLVLKKHFLWRYVNITSNLSMLMPGPDESFSTGAGFICGQHSTSSFDWTDLPTGTSLTLNVTMPNVTNNSTQNLTNDTAHRNLTGNLSGNLTSNQTGNLTNSSSTTNLTLVARVCLQATWIPQQTASQISTRETYCRSTCVLANNSGNVTYNATCMDICRNAIPPRFEEWCSVVPAEDLPPDAVAAAIQVLPLPGCGTFQPCVCNNDVVRVEVLWRGYDSVDHDLAYWQARYDYAVMLPIWDQYPLQAYPQCNEDTVTFAISADDIHPERQYVNRTTFPFYMIFINPARAPLMQENFWMVRHSKDTVESSDAIPGWNIIAKPRFLRVELINEVVLPSDRAILHIEYVSVGPADRLIIEPIAPPGFDFSGATLLTGSGTGQDNAVPPEIVRRRLLWQGFTVGLRVEEALSDRVTIRFTIPAQRLQYIRLRLGGVAIPWGGDQAKFNVYTSKYGKLQDQILHCCNPGEPIDNPAVVFFVPYRLRHLRGHLQNRYHQQQSAFPVASTLEQRLNELNQLKFLFQLPSPHVAPAGSIMAIVLRAPHGYKFQQPWAAFRAAICPENPGGCLRTGKHIEMVAWEPRRIVMFVYDVQVIPTESDVELAVYVQSPVNYTVMRANSMWIIGLTDSVALINNKSATTLTGYPDFNLKAQANLSVTSQFTAPEVLIEVQVTIRTLGERTPTQVDIYGPPGWIFAPRCLKAGQTSVIGIFLSCREKWNVFGTKILSGAVLMVSDKFNFTRLPVTFVLLGRTPPRTPDANYWYLRANYKAEPLAWGIEETPFTIRAMQATVSYAAIASTNVDIFLSIDMRVDLPWDGFIYFGAPRTYKLFCPVGMISGDVDPVCIDNDPALVGCWGLPTPQDNYTVSGMPLCNPEHEVFLQVPNPNSTDGEKKNSQVSRQVALPQGSVLLLVMKVVVPESTPLGEDQNLFIIRVLDPNKIPLDTHPRYPANEVRTRPRVYDVKMWWSSAVPSSVVSVAIQFSINGTIVRGQEPPDGVLRVVEIVCPVGLRIGVQRPKDVFILQADPGMPVVEWNWTDAFPEKLWFGFDVTKNVTGTFHYSFPVLTPEVIPGNNLWHVKLCNDGPYCINEILNIPVPGFFFGTEPTVKLNSEAEASLYGSCAQHFACPGWHQTIPVWLLLALYHSSSSS